MLYLINNNFIFLFTISTLLLSLIIDLVIGELPVSIHPVVIVGKLIDFFEKHFIKIRNRASGVLLYFSVMIISLFILFIILYIVKINEILFFIIFSVILSSTYSIKLLLSSAKDVEDKLNRDIDEARQAVSYLVSRNTKTLSESFIVSATVETLSENITDSYIAPVFYYMIFSNILLIFNKNLFIILLFIPVIYRISNTLDAMVGYENDRLRFIGYFPAKIDDILNYIPARISGLFVVLSAFVLGLNYKNSFLMYKRDSRKCPSPNSGFTMATVAGALDIQLVKKETYVLGDANKEIKTSDISTAIRITALTIGLFTLFVFILLGMVYMVI